VRIEAVPLVREHSKGLCGLSGIAAQGVATIELGCARFEARGWTSIGKCANMSIRGAIAIEMIAGAATP
jgi:hypothetical protein